METQVQKQVKEAQVNRIDKLRKEAKQNEVFRSVCMVFAERQRARSQVTMHNLITVMKHKGYNYSREELVQVLKFLAHLGLGKPEYSRRHKLRAIKDIKVTLQSIGQVAIDKASTLSNWQSHIQYTKIAPWPKEEKKEPQVVKDDVKSVSLRYQAELIVRFSKDETTTFKLPAGISPKELGLLLSGQYSSKS